MCVFSTVLLQWEIYSHLEEYEEREGRQSQLLATYGQLESAV